MTGRKAPIGSGSSPLKTSISSWWFGTMEFYDFHFIYGNVIIPTDELHHFSEGLKPPTSYS